MYRKKYGVRPRCVPFRKRRPCGKKSNSKKHPFYGNKRRRPRAFERDYVLFCKGRGIKPEEKPEPAVEESDSDDEDVVEEVKDPGTKIVIKSVDLHIDDNSLEHHTSTYGCTKDRHRKEKGEDVFYPAELVIRRGFPFQMTIEFDRPYDIKKDDITLSFFLDDEPKPKPDLQPTFKVDETGKKKFKRKWGASVVKKAGNSLTLSVFVPASAPVGEWEFTIRTATEVDGKDVYQQYTHNDDINIIFNPWCKEDWVYLDDDKWRNEAVLNDSGVQYRGSHSSMGAKTWFFGQFEDGMLDAAFHLVRKGFDASACPAMGNAAKVARMVSQIVNDFDDMGVLTGNWSGDYEGGVSPGDWCGSVRILKKYMDSGKPVKYGQCWVFSAVVTTVCRALGMPCRSVTNFASAHNTDMEHLSIDKFDKSTGKESNDSVWNFHVWNEVWMRRPDLSTSKEWDGWQVIDATPQELSGGVYCCGPAPVKAIREGELTVGQDTAFIFAEVNADRTYFTMDRKSGQIKELKFLRETASVGKCVSTHNPTGEPFVGESGSDEADRDVRMERLDLTNDYKYEEGSDKEREIVKKAEKMFQIMNGGGVVDVSEDEDEEEDEGPPQPPVAIEIEKPLPVLVGNPFSFKVKVTNTGSETVAIKDVVLKVVYKTYDDKSKGTAARQKEKDVNLDTKAEKLYTITVDENKACARPQDGFFFELRASVSFYDGTVSRKDVNFRLRRPDVIVKGPPHCKLGETVKIDLSFTNPLKTDLTNCSVLIDGGFDLDNLDDDIIKIPKIGGKATWKQTVTAKPRRHPHGQEYRALSVNFKSKQLEEIDGFIRIQLKDK